MSTTFLESFPIYGKSFGGRLKELGSWVIFLLDLFPFSDEASYVAHPGNLQAISKIWNLQSYSLL
jgi:hypothetical protein